MSRHLPDLLPPETARRLDLKLRAAGYVPFRQAEELADEIAALAVNSFHSYRPPEQIFSAWTKGDGEKFESICLAVRHGGQTGLHFLTGSFHRSMWVGLRLTEGNMRVSPLSLENYLTAGKPGHASSATVDNLLAEALRPYLPLKLHNVTHGR